MSRTEAENCAGGVEHRQGEQLMSAVRTLIRRVTTAPPMVAIRTYNRKGSCTKSEYGRRVSGAITLGDAELCRAIPITKVLHCCSRILSSNAGTSEDYELSVPVQRIDAFLSHTWRTSRCAKFLTLMIYYNIQPAIIGSVCCSMTVSILVALDLLPEITLVPTFQLVGNATFLFLSFTWHEISNLLRLPSQMVFLDKACVHQTDNELKRKGVEGLAAFLHKSRSLVVLYSEDYTKRLWTVYELASFLLLHKEGHLQIVPTELPAIILLVFALLLLDVYFTRIAMTVHKYLAKGFISHEHEIIFIFLNSLGLAILLGYWAKKVKRMCRQLEDFDIQQAECTSEADRPFVESNVEAFVKHIGEVSPDSTPAEALAAFNRLVRKRVPKLMRASLGRFGVRYRLALVIFMPLVFRPFDAIATLVADHRTAIDNAPEYLHPFFQTFAAGPLIIWVGAFTTRMLAHKEGWAAVAATVFTTCVIQLVTHAIRASLLQLWTMADQTVAGLVLFIAYGVFLLLLTYLAYGQHSFCGSDTAAEFRFLRFRSMTMSTITTSGDDQQGEKSPCANAASPPEAQDSEPEAPARREDPEGAGGGV